MMGSQTQETADMMVSSLELPITPEELIEQSKKQFQALFPNTEVLPGNSNYFYSNTSGPFQSLY